MGKIVEVILEVEIPDEATKFDFKEWMDVELLGVNGMKLNNPCRGDNTEILSGEFKWPSN